MQKTMNSELGCVEKPSESDVEMFGHASVLKEPYFRTAAGCRVAAIICSQSSSSKTILGLRKFYCTLFSLLERFHFFSKRLYQFSFKWWGFYSYAYCPPWCRHALLKWWIVLVVMWCWMWMIVKLSKEGSWDMTWLATVPSASSSALWGFFQVNKDCFFLLSFQPSFFSV